MPNVSLGFFLVAFSSSQYNESKQSRAWQCHQIKETDHILGRTVREIECSGQSTREKETGTEKLQKCAQGTQWGYY